MKFLDKIKDLFSDEEEIIETKEIEVEENDEHKLPTFMRNKIEEEEKQKNDKIKREAIIKDSDNFSDREIVKTRSNNNFSFPIEMDDPEPINHEIGSYNNQNILLKERERDKEKPTPVSNLANLYSKKEEPKPKKFRPTPVISPIYGVLDKNYTKDEVKVQDESSYEIQRPSRKIDFETVRNKAFGNLTDDIRNNLCENCELYQEVKITKNADRRAKISDDNLLSDMTDDVPLGVAEENYFDFGVSYETPKREEVRNNAPVVNIDDLEINNNIKIINHNEEESTAEKIEVKEEKKDNKKLLEDTIEFEKITHDEESAESILNKNYNTPLEDIDNDIFNLIDSMYDEEDK